MVNPAAARVTAGERIDRPGSAAFYWAVNIVGDRCTLLVLYQISAGAHRFNDIQRNIGAPRDRLALRLRRLE